MYQPIAEVAFEKGLLQQTGNIERREARALARDGIAALPDATARALASSASWSAADQEALTADLVASHCGHMPDAMIGPMTDEAAVTAAANFRL